MMPDRFFDQRFNITQFKSRDPLSENSNQEKCELAGECWFITGATAGGKTELAILLAQRLDGEILSLDSMTVYRGMNVGTAKPSSEELEQVTHHLIDICDPNESFSVSRYRDLALEKIADIKSRNRIPIFVGGTALYLKIMLRGMFEGPAADGEFRMQVEAEVERVGLAALHQRLQQVDPVSAHKLHPTDRRRIIRALEVHKTTGQPISHLQREFDEGHNKHANKVFAVRHPREILHQRIEQRVQWMLDNGLVDEVQGLLEKYGELGHTAAQAVGYRETIEHLNGDLSAEDLFERILVRTRRFARHQETWFRGMPECQFMDVEGEFDAQQVAGQLIERAASAESKQ